MATAPVSRVVFTRLVPQVAARCTALGFNVASFPEESVGATKADIIALVSAEPTHGLVCFLSDKIDAEVIDAAGPDLKVISTMSVGFDHIDIAECTKRGIKVGHTPGVLSNASAELTVGLLLSVMRKLPACAKSVKDGGWGTWELFGYCGEEVRGKTLGIVGLGGIGVEVAKILAGGFGCKVLYSGPREKPETAATVPGGATYVSFDELLATSDIVSMHCPATPDTIGSMNAEAFAKMKSSAFFINTTRGPVVNQDDLVHALRTGVIKGAGLDVTTPEPLPTDHPLLTLDNCVVLPHICSATYPTRNAIIDLAMDNLEAGVAGTAMPHCANKN